jgi:flavin-dependent dehydrogenase
MASEKSSSITTGTTPCDVLIIGGGPAGSTIATKLAEKGRHVVMLEKASHPRFHIGESLLPMNLPILEELGVIDEIEKIGIRKYGAEFNSMQHDFSALYSFGNALNENYPYAYEVKRGEFDKILFDNAIRKGAHAHENTRVTKVDFQPDKSSIIEAKDGSGNIQRWHAKFLVDASGRSTFLASDFKIKKRSKKHNSAALFGHFKNVVRRKGLEEGNISLCWFEHGWFWMIPFKDGTMSVGAVCWPYYLNSRKKDAESFLWDTIATCPAVADRMKEAELISEVSATGNFTYQADRMAGDGYLMIGDAFAFIDPVFSSGVLLGMTGGLKGAEVVDGILDNPANAEKLTRKFNKNVRRGLKIFSWFIYRITQPSMRRLFMGDEAERERRSEAGITSLLAGDLFSNQPLRRHLFVFKFFYYAFFLLELRKNIAAKRKRQFDLKQGAPTQAKDENYTI